MTASPPGQPLSSPAIGPQSLRGWLITIAVLALAFVRPLMDLVAFSLKSSLFSHVILVPFVSAYLFWSERHRLPAPASRDPFAALIPFAAAVIVLAAFWFMVLSRAPLARETSLALTMLAFILFVVAATAYFLGRMTLRAAAFPLFFLVFMMPFPPSVVDAIEVFLQHGSAAVAAVMFRTVGTPLLRDELIFQLPGMTLEVAPECSGIRSSLALFITSLVAGYLFLRSAWKRAILSLAVIPLALIRNGFRVFTIGELCVHISPDMINSFIHHQGGPIFFALSLIPFGLLLFYLMKRERRVRPLRTVSSS